MTSHSWPPDNAQRDGPFVLRSSRDKQMPLITYQDTVSRQQLLRGMWEAWRGLLCSSRTIIARARRRTSTTKGTCAGALRFSSVRLLACTKQIAQAAGFFGANAAPMQSGDASVPTPTFCRGAVVACTPLASHSRLPPRAEKASVTAASLHNTHTHARTHAHTKKKTPRSGIGERVR